MVSFPMWMILFLIAEYASGVTTTGSLLPPNLISPRDCQTSDGCFFVFTSNQCFCFLDNETANYGAAKALCEDPKRGWKLPHPTDVAALRAGLFQWCGNCGDFWMNAAWYPAVQHIPCFGMCWNDVAVEITPANPYFASGQPSLRFGPGTCLVMRVTEAAMNGNNGADLGKPYYTGECAPTNATDNNHKHLLCEKFN